VGPMGFESELVVWPVNGYVTVTLFSEELMRN
jgi:hypothetical protein